MNAASLPKLSEENLFKKGGLLARWILGCDQFACELFIAGSVLYFPQLEGACPAEWKIADLGTHLYIMGAGLFLLSSVLQIQLVKLKKKAKRSYSPCDDIQPLFARIVNSQPIEKPILAPKTYSPCDDEEGVVEMLWSV